MDGWVGGGVGVFVCLCMVGLVQGRGGYRLYVGLDWDVLWMDGWMGGWMEGRRDDTRICE